MWSQLEPTPPHLTYLVLSAFLLVYALFSHFIRNSLHLSEPPLATLLGITLGPEGFDIIGRHQWGVGDGLTQEATRVIVGLQVFSVGIELPKAYFARHWRSVGLMLGPVMTVSWLVTALFVFLLLNTSPSIAFTISACLSPTDPVLAASVLAESRFSNRVPRRLRHLLAAESGCNDGVSFPFLFATLYPVIAASPLLAVRDWILTTIFYQCLLGLAIGALLGLIANRALRLACERHYISPSSFLVFYFLLAIFAIGLASTIGSDDYLVAFGTGTAFGWDGWFGKRTKQAHLPQILDLILNASMFVYFGAVIPWKEFSPRAGLTPDITPLRLAALLILILLFRRIPIVLALKRINPDIHTYGEALFCGHFGPMGLGALFLAIVARAQLETGTSVPPPHPKPDAANRVAVATVWPVVCFVVLGSIVVHGFSALAISIVGHFSRKEEDRAPLLGAEEDPLYGMAHDANIGDSEPSVSGDDGDVPR